MNKFNNMTQEQKDLLLKDLCARLPYGVKVKFGDSEPTLLTVIEHDEFGWQIGSEDEFGGMITIIDNVKPYLFPLSSMTEEQKKELNVITDLDIEIAITHIKNDTPNYVTGLNRLNWLLKNHFDIYDLIPMGLATDATDKNIY